MLVDLGTITLLRRVRLGSVLISSTAKPLFTNNTLQITNYKLQITNYKLQITNYSFERERERERNININIEQFFRT